ncbi:MAG TPA: hypothetical protein VKV19_11485 [Ktedonobacteraceae bacterium]|nr:hypothetical protein [Ktedonobacteraceae bacterium]
MDDRHLHLRPVVRAEDIVKISKTPVSRRELLRLGLFGTATAAATLAGIDALVWAPKRVAMAATSFPDIQFDIGNFINPVETINSVPVHFGPIYTFLLPAKLNRNPTLADQTVLANALNTIEANYAFSPSGIFVFVSYGLPYFNRLPSSLVASHMPLRNDGSNQPVLQEAVPSPTDVSPLNPGISKQTFNVPVQIESNDVLFTLRSDILGHATDVVAWFQGSNSLNGASVPSPAFNGLFSFGTPRVNFVQQGLPRTLANQNNFPYAFEINPASTMWMGFVDQQVGGSAPSGATVTFAGTSSAILTTAHAGDYFDNGAIQHLSHDIQDLAQFYADPDEPFSERVQYMFRSKMNNGQPGLPYFEDPNDAFTDGGGQNAPEGDIFQKEQSAYLFATNFGPNDQATNYDPAVLVQVTNPHKKYRVGHLCGLQRSSRAGDGTPLHIRMDGPGLNTLDVPGGALQPTLEFTIFVPTAEFFRVMRVNAASLDYVKAGQGGGTAASVPPGVEAADADDDGLERFLTATRRQNFLCPPRRHRAFPLLELA